MTVSIQLTRSSRPAGEEQRREILRNPGFGQFFTDHMATAEWTPEGGWHDARVRPRETFSIDPASAVLHYAQEIFEGMKAYRNGDGQIIFFRPEENARRFARSAERMAMPAMSEDLFLRCLQVLVDVDQDWVPAGECSLYLRPFMFADESFLGVRPAARYRFCIIASPAGTYFKGGLRPISVWVSEDHSRAARGGTGEAKCGGNYAGSLIGQSVAARHGCDQVVFLDASGDRSVEELGGMNIFFVMDDGSLLTPPLGTILPGITRASIMTLARDAGLSVREERYSLEQWAADASGGRLLEAFACGTAATVVPIGKMKYARGAVSIGDGNPGAWARKFREELVGIQTGSVDDRHGWVRALSELAGRA